MKHRPSRLATDGFMSFAAIFVVFVLIVVGVVGYMIVHKDSNQPSTATSGTSTKTQAPPAANSYAVLSPATVASKTAECSTPIAFQSNGNSGPIQCPNGDLNVTEWNALAALEPSVMSLGYSATAAQVQTALCNDANASNSDANTKNSFVVEQTVYQITALYYGWSFPSNPSSVLNSDTC